MLTENENDWVINLTKWRSRVKIYPMGGWKKRRKILPYWKILLAITVARVTDEFRGEPGDGIPPHPFSEDLRLFAYSWFRREIQSPLSPFSRRKMSEFNSA